MLSPRSAPVLCRDRIAARAIADTLLAAAGTLRDYTAARWTVGAARRGILLPQELPSRPAELKNDIKLPKDCSREASLNWALELTGSFRRRTEAALAEDAIESLYERYQARLAGLLDTEQVLLWHSGKDLFAALDRSLYQSVADNPRSLRRRLRNWAREHPEEAVALFPEWQALRALLR